MLRRALLLASVVLAAGACSASAPDTAADEAALRAVVPVWWEHFNKGDADGVANLYAEDAILLAPGVPAAVGRAAIREVIARDISAAGAGGYTFQGGEITGLGVSGDMGWASGTFSVQDSAGAAIEAGKYLSLYHRADGEWKLIRDTWNSDSAPAAAPAPASPTG